MTQILTNDEIDDLLTAIDSCHLTDCRFWDKEEDLNCRKRGERSSCYNPRSKRRVFKMNLFGYRLSVKFEKWRDNF